MSEEDERLIAQFSELVLKTELKAVYEILAIFKDWSDECPRAKAHLTLVKRVVKAQA